MDEKVFNDNKDEQEMDEVFPDAPTEEDFVSDIIESEVEEEAGPEKEGMESDPKETIEENGESAKQQEAGEEKDELWEEMLRHHEEFIENQGEQILDEVEFAKDEPKEVEKEVEKDETDFQREVNKWSDGTKRSKIVGFIAGVVGAIARIIHVAITNLLFDGNERLNLGRIFNQAARNTAERKMEKAMDQKKVGKEPAKEQVKEQQVKEQSMEEFREESKETSKDSPVHERISQMEAYMLAKKEHSGEEIAESQTDTENKTLDAAILSDLLQKESVIDKLKELKISIQYDSNEKDLVYIWNESASSNRNVKGMDVLMNQDKSTEYVKISVNKFCCNTNTQLKTTFIKFSLGKSDEDIKKNAESLCEVMTKAQEEILHVKEKQEQSQTLEENQEQPIQAEEDACLSENREETEISDSHDEQNTVIQKVEAVAEQENELEPEEERDARNVDLEAATDKDVEQEETEIQETVPVYQHDDYEPEL